MKIRLVVAILLLPFPSIIKVLVYRIGFRYKIGKRVKIGLSVIAVKDCSIEDGVEIKHFNVFYATSALRLGANVKVGHFNIIMGGREVDIGEGSHIFRFNEINSIINPITLNSCDPKLVVGARSLITASHKIDFVDRVEMGENTVFAGRNSNIWTHNRQQTRPVKIGRNCYIGANVQFAPGASVGDYCVVALGSVVTKKIDESWTLIGGVPAKPLKQLDEESKVFVTYPTRPDLDGSGPIPIDD